MILPEIGEEEANGVDLRICERLANDGHLPQAAVSVGVSMHPKDGVTVEKLFGAVDRALYRMKRHDKKQFRLGNVAACL